MRFYDPEAVLVKYLPNMKLRASRCVPGHIWRLAASQEYIINHAVDTKEYMLLLVGMTWPTKKMGSKQWGRLKKKYLFLSQKIGSQKILGPKKYWAPANVWSKFGKNENEVRYSTILKLCCMD